MPCYKPLSAHYVTDSDGKIHLTWSNVLAVAFQRGVSMPDTSTQLKIPCGRCIGCRLEHSRQWAVRCMHEAQLYERNCFITLTYDEENLPIGETLVKEHFVDFMKRLRKRFCTPPTDLRGIERDKWFKQNGIRYYHGGEYGENLSRPHYHAILFNFDFPDKTQFSKTDTGYLYVSDILDDVWGMGFCTIGDVTFESCAYVSRYCTKKVTGEDAHDYYEGRTPEYATMSRKPGIGGDWYLKYSSDVFPSDDVIMRSHQSKPPRFYDERLRVEDPELYELIKLRRLERAEKKREESSYKRLQVKEKVKNEHMKRLYRQLEI